ncbi:hypothetical protein RV14_GL001188 [Enterococcus ratti]|uniref:Transposase n=1 Tax=Enterococcus ratti TaxID=150033 RepID=A0A1L8WB27_9ENTE|nr:hypothetical protein RV14_GL001188 [Enterococcus ratti]
MFIYTVGIKLCYNEINEGVIFLKIGYARISTGLQNLDLQEDSLNKFGCEKIFTDQMKKYKIIEPYLNKQETIKEIAIKNKIPTRTLYRWVQKYEHDGLVGLIRKTRTDFEQIRISEEVRQKIEEFVLRYKKISTKTLSRKIASYCKENKLDVPSYSQAYKLRKRIPKSLIQLAHEERKYIKRIMI